MQGKTSTPWGLAQSLRAVGEGIIRVDTAGHGGYFVPASLLYRIPAEQQAWAARWSGSEQWYEEDCCWAAVVVAFPELFPADAVEQAERIVDRYCPSVAVA